MDIEELKKRAESAGIDYEVHDCRVCRGKGQFLRPDPLDLQLFRERHGASMYAVARFYGIHVSYIKRIEEVNPAKVQSCSEKVFLAYLDIPNQAWKPGKKIDPSGMRGRTLSEQKVILKQRREARELRRKAKEAAKHVRKGDVWVKSDIRYEVLQVLDLPGTREPSVLLRRMDRDTAQPRTVRASVVVEKYRKEEVAA